MLFAVQRVSEERASELKEGVLWLEDPRCCEQELVGSKAAALARLTALGYDVPDGFCVTTQALAEGAEVYGRALLEAAQRLDSPLVARSSATVEDSPDHLFPGLFTTILGLSDREELLRAVAKIAAGSHDGAVAAYAERVGVDPGSIHMAVIVQTLVPATAAGVAFSRHPMTGERQVLVEANHGLGVTVVDGSADPDRFSVASGAVVARELGSKQVKAVINPGGVGRSAATERERLTPAISDRQVTAIAAVAEELEDALGHPVDLEWAIAGSRLYVLQARPFKRGAVG